MHAVLHVDFLGLVAGEGGVEPGEEALGLHLGELFFVEEVGGFFLVAEEEPVLAGGAGDLALLEEGAEGRDAGAGADHDDGGVGRGHVEMFGGLDVDGDLGLVQLLPVAR